MTERGGHPFIGITIIHTGLPSNNPGDVFVQSAFEEATRDIDNAVNHTLRTLVNRPRNGPPLSAGELMRLVRFPNAAARQLARSAEIYERTLYLIKKHVEAGMKVNLSHGMRISF